VNVGTLLAYLTVKVQCPRILPAFASASVSEMDCIPAELVDDVEYFIRLFAHFEHSL